MCSSHLRRRGPAASLGADNLSNHIIVIDYRAGKRQPRAAAQIRGAPLNSAQAASSRRIPAENPGNPASPSRAAPRYSPH